MTIHQAQLLKRMDTLPVLPHVVTRVMALDLEAPNFFDELVRVIETEPTYAARLVAAANSALQSAAMPIHRIRDAVVRLGAREVCNLIISMSVVRVFVPRTDWEKGLWVHALEVASVARALARQHGAGLDCDTAYLSGLLHDLGRFIMFDAAPQALREVDEAQWDSPDKMIEAERSVCGLSHAELGAEMCTRWSLPRAFVEVVKEHHAPDIEARLGERGHLLRLVQVADKIGFSSVSAEHKLTALRSMAPVEANAYMFKALPTWYRACEGMVQVVTDALADADRVAAQVGLKLKPVGAATSAAARKPR